MTIPLIRPRPPRLSEAADALRSIEDSGIFSNFGPVNTRFEQDLTERMFGGTGGCATVCNATIGLMLAIRNATKGQKPRQKYALMPSFTFAAAAQAALWCGLTPLFCDIDPQTWCSDAMAEERLLQRHRGEIAVVMPYATFGANIDLSRYELLQAKHGVPVVVDAAASLGTRSAAGVGFGTGFSGAIVFSMHATKSFATGEGGIIYSADPGAIERLRAMANFGFGQPRTATMPGLNAKLSEVGALLAQLRLDGYDAVVQVRSALLNRYRARLPELVFQGMGDPPTSDLPLPGRALQAHQFAPALLPRSLAPFRGDVQSWLATQGIGMATYFSPHLAQQPFFAGCSKWGRLDVTDDIGARIISLPIYDDMTFADVDAVASCLTATIRTLQPEAAAVKSSGLAPGPVAWGALAPGSAAAQARRCLAGEPAGQRAALSR